MSVRVVGLGLGFISHILLSRSLGTSGYGLYAVVIGWSLILAVPVKSGLDYAVLKYGAIYISESKLKDIRGLMGYCFRRILIMSVVVTAFIVTSTWISPGLLGVESLVQAFVMALLVVSISCIGIWSAFFRAKRKIFSSQVYEQVVRSSFLIVLIGFLALMGFSFTLTSALTITAVSALLALVLLAVHLRKTFSDVLSVKASDSKKSAWFDLSWPLLLISAAQQIMSQSTIILLAWFSTAEQVGVFAAASRLNAFLPFALVALNSITAPMIASYYKHRDYSALRRIAYTNARIALLFSSIGALVFYFFGRELLSVFGTEFSEAYPILLILLIGALTTAAVGSSGLFLVMTGQQRISLLIIVTALLLSISTALIMIPRYGMIGGAWSSVIGVLVTNIGQFAYVRYWIGIDSSFLGLNIRKNNTLVS